MSENNFKVLFIGDVVGKPGRQTLKKFLVEEGNNSKYDFIIVNGENASHGFGLTKKNHDELLEYGVDCITSGNHIWDKKDINSYIGESSALIRPYNYHNSVGGVGYKLFNDKIIVINLLGKTFMNPINCPFESLKTALDEIKLKTNIQDKIIFIDFHAEASAEKICFAKFANELGVTCVVGTHTHVQTTDEQIIDSKTAYITDVGMCGSAAGVIGMEYQSSLSRLITSINTRFDVEQSAPYLFNAVEIDFSDCCAININRINLKYDCLEGEANEN